MAQPHNKLFHEDTQNDPHGSEWFKQLESPSNDTQLQGKTLEDKQHQLENYEKENAVLIAKTSVSLENQEHLHQKGVNTMNQQRPSNAYLTPIWQQTFQMNIQMEQ